MADFAGLIRKAMSGQNSNDPAIRQRIYQSSRNALIRMLEKTGNVADETVRAQFEQLEKSIAAIEAEYSATDETVTPSPRAEAAPIADPPQPVEPGQQIPDPSANAGQPEAAPVPGSETAAPSLLSPRSVQSAPIANPASAPDPAPAPEPVSQATGVPPKPDLDLPPAASQQSPTPTSPPINPASAAPAAGPASTPPSAPPVESTYEPAPLFPPPSREPVAEPVEPVDLSRSEPDFEVPQPQTATSPGTSYREPVFEPEPPATHEGLSAEQEYSTATAPEVVEPYLGDAAPSAGSDTASLTVAQGETVDDLKAGSEPPPTYRRKNPLLRRIWPIFLAIAVLFVILWILYALLATQAGDDGSSPAPTSVGETSTSEDGTTFITLLQPTDLSALVTAGRGSAELVTEQNRQMLRLKSVRPDGQTDRNAEPILLELERGVLRQITGREVTVEIFAKSGSAGPAQFAVQCDISGDSICGRKRFRVGLQPERIVFSLDLKDGISTEQRAYLAISTDITNAANASGSGDVIDIIHVRLRLNEG